MKKSSRRTHLFSSNRCSESETPPSQESCQQRFIAETNRSTEPSRDKGIVSIQFRFCSFGIRSFSPDPLKSSHWNHSLQKKPQNRFCENTNVDITKTSFYGFLQAVEDHNWVSGTLQMGDFLRIVGHVYLIFVHNFFLFILWTHLDCCGFCFYNDLKMGSRLITTHEYISSISNFIHS